MNFSVCVFMLICVFFLHRKAAIAPITSEKIKRRMTSWVLLSTVQFILALIYFRSDRSVPSSLTCLAPNTSRTLSSRYLRWIESTLTLSRDNLKNQTESHAHHTYFSRLVYGVPNTITQVRYCSLNCGIIVSVLHLDEDDKFIKVCKL